MEEASIIELKDVAYRSIQYCDMDEIKAIHNEAFPIKYSDEYYFNACNQRGIDNGDLQTIIAYSKINNEILGFIFYQFLLTSDCEDQNLFKSDSLEICYVLVIGLKQSCPKGNIVHTQSYVRRSTINKELRMSRSLVKLWGLVNVCNKNGDRVSKNDNSCHI